MKSDWLADLAPEHAPAAPSWWPPAPGWWILVLGGLALLLAAWIWWRNPRRRLRRRALQELAAIRACAAARAAAGAAAGAVAGGEAATEAAQAVQNLLRRYALAVFGHDAVAGLSGPAWLGFLAARGGDAFGGAVGQSMLDAAYGAQRVVTTSDARAGWFAAAEKFLRRAVPPKRARPPKAAAPPKGATPTEGAAPPRGAVPRGRAP